MYRTSSCIAVKPVEAKLKQGIESAVQKKIVKLIKDSKLKVQAQIQGKRFA